MQNFQRASDEEFAAMNDAEFEAWWNAAWDRADRDDEQEAAFWAARDEAEARRAGEAA